MILVNDIKRQNEFFQSELEKIFYRKLHENSFIGGEDLYAFENDFKSFGGFNNFLGTSNGTDAISLPLTYLGIERGDEVIVPTETWISTAEVVVARGATPVFCDVNDNGTICPIDLEKKLTAKTKAIIIVHLYGNACELDRIIEVASKWDVPIIEDCAQAHGTYYKGVHVGNFGLCGTFSFYPGKNLGALGDAGGLASNDDEFFNFAKHYINHGSLKKNFHKLPGLNMRLDSIQAAFLRLKLTKLEEWNTKRREIALRYDSNISSLDLKIPISAPDTLSSYHQYVIVSKYKTFSEVYNDFVKEQISIQEHYPLPLHKLKIWSEKSLASCPNADCRTGRKISLPMHPYLTISEQDKIINVMHNVFK